MKYRGMKKTKRFRSDLVKEGRALTKTAFELVLVFAVILFVFVFVFSVFFRVAGFPKKTADGTQYYSIVNTARKLGKPIRYFTNASAVKCAEQIVENDKR